MTPASFPPLASLMTGYWISQAIYVAARLDLAEIVHQRGPQTAAQLAEATATQPEALYRLLRALASAGVFREDGNGCFHLTHPAELR